MSEPTQERWLPVVGYGGFYEVSDQGRVRSLDRWGTKSNGDVAFYRGMVRKTQPHYAGHRKLMLLRDGTHEGFFVHVLVLTAFVGPCPPGLMCRHLNGVPDDNRLQNLAWGTCSENKYDQVRHGTDAQASKTHCIHGHPFDAINTYVYQTAKGGFARGCKECRRELVRKRRARLRSAA